MLYNISKVSFPLKTVILIFLEKILTLNKFIFNGENYLQIKDCAMGTKYAPSYANLLQDNFESKYTNHKPKYQNIPSIH